MSKKNDAVFESFNKARVNLRATIFSMLILTALFVTAFNYSKSDIKTYISDVNTIESNPKLLQEYRIWVNAKIAEYSRKKYSAIFSDIEQKLGYKLVDTPTVGLKNIPITIGRIEKTTVEGVTYSTTPMLPRELNYWLNELPFRFSQNSEVSLIEKNSLEYALQHGEFECSNNKSFWSFCDIASDYDISNYPSGAVYFSMNTSIGKCSSTKDQTSGLLKLNCVSHQVPNTSFLNFLTYTKIPIPNVLLNPPTNEAIAKRFGDLKSIDEFKQKAYQLELDQSKATLSNVNLSSNYIVSGFIFVISILIFLIISDLKFCRINMSIDDKDFSLVIIHEDKTIFITTWTIISLISINFIVSAFLFVEKSLGQIFMLSLSSLLLISVLAILLKASIAIRLLISTFKNE